MMMTAGLGKYRAVDGGSGKVGVVWGVTKVFDTQTSVY